MDYTLYPDFYAVPMYLRTGYDLQAGWLTEGSLHGFHPQMPVPQQEWLTSSRADSESLHVTVAAVRKINAVLAFARLYSMEMEVLLHKQLTGPHVEAAICEEGFGCIVRWPMLLGCDHHF